MIDEIPEFREPFKNSNLDEIFYIGEVMVRKNNRSQGLGTKLLGKMLDLIDKNRFKVVGLYTVDRGDNHPSKPEIYRSPESLWSRYGFQKKPNSFVYLKWLDLGNQAETEKPMNVWIKELC
jgi:GNAT superfamily N-acetyltransferase